MLPVLLVAPFLSQADATITNVATPSIHADLGASGAALELVVGGYLIAFAVLLVTGARLGQTHGYRRMFLLGLAVFGLASLVCGVAPNPMVLVAARVVQGAAAALMFPQTLTGIQLNFVADARARAVGLFAVALSTGAVVGQIAGGVLVSANIAGAHWRTIFLVNVPIVLATLAAGVRYLPGDVGRTARRVDGVGIAILSSALLLLVLPLTLGHTQGWPTWSWTCLAASVPAMALFLAVERRRTAANAAPLVNTHLLAHPRVAWGLATLLGASGTYFALLFTLAQYLQQGLGRSPLVSGLTLVSWVAAFGLAGQLVRRLPARVAHLVPVSGCLLLAGAYAAISVTLFAGRYTEAPLVVVLGLGGFGLGIQFSAQIAQLTNAVAAEYAADLSGVSTTTSQIGGALGVAGFGTLYLGLAPGGGAPQASQAFAVTAAALAVTALLATATAWLAARARTTGHDTIGRDTVGRDTIGRDTAPATTAGHDTVGRDTAPATTAAATPPA